MSHLSTTTQADIAPSAKEEKDDSLTDYHSGLIALSVLILISNLFAIQIYIRHIKVRRNLSNVLLLSLSISDLIAGVVVLPVMLYCEREYSLEKHVLITTCRVNYLLQNFCGFSTILHIITVTIEKYIAVLYPFQRINVTTSSTYKRTLIGLWVMALLFALVPVFWLFNKPKSPAWEKKIDNYGIFQIVIFFGVSLVILSYCYCRMFVKIYGKLSNRSQATRAQARMQNERKTVVVFLTFFALFVIGWLPWFLVSLNPNNFADFPRELVDFLITLRFAGALLNPYIYAFLKNDYKEAVLVDLGKCCTRCPTRLQIVQPRKQRSFSENNNFGDTTEHTFDYSTSSGIKLRPHHHHKNPSYKVHYTPGEETDM